jgi:hypothetical protein
MQIEKMPSGKRGDAEVLGRVCGCFTLKPRLAAHSIIVAALFIFGACNAAAASSSSALPPTSAAAAALVAPSPQGNQNRGGGRRGSGVGERGWEREGAESHRKRDEWVREDGVRAVGGSVEEHDWGWATDGDLMERLTRFEAKVDALAHTLDSLLVLSQSRETQDTSNMFAPPAMRGGGRVGVGGLQTDASSGNDWPEAEKSRGDRVGWVLWALVVHEVWVLMQHGNVLLNPYLQRLDRDYGIALLRKRMYSVIAAVLAAYWAR